MNDLELSSKPNASRQRRRWSWWLWTLVLFAGQIAILFWLGDRGAVPKRKLTAAPLLRLAGQEPSELLRLTDPTLFARPHWDSFSGAAWLNVPPAPPRPAEPAEPPLLLALPDDRLGAAFNDFMRTNKLEVADSLWPVVPDLTSPPPAPLVFAPDSSSYHLEDGLEHRRLLSALKPPVLEHTDILSNSIVQLVVDEEGRPLSVTLLAGSGLVTADSNALALARAARFEPLNTGGPDHRPGPSRLSWGKLIFDWAVRPPGISK